MRMVVVPGWRPRPWRWWSGLWPGWLRAGRVGCDGGARAGGGYGTILGAVLAAHPHLHGILLDRHDVLPGAAGYLAAHGADSAVGRCVLTAGDYLNPAGIPAADVYLLGSILHGHHDD
jgi:O-methyltransferase domain